MIGPPGEMNLIRCLVKQRSQTLRKTNVRDVQLFVGAIASVAREFH
jgi:hypothetical protein